MIPYKAIFRYANTLLLIVFVCWSAIQTVDDLTPPLHWITLSRASGTADHVRSLDDNKFSTSTRTNSILPLTTNTTTHISNLPSRNHSPFYPSFHSPHLHLITSPLCIFPQSHAHIALELTNPFLLRRRVVVRGSGQM